MFRKLLFVQREYINVLRNRFLVKLRDLTHVQSRKNT